MLNELTSPPAIYGSAVAGVPEDSGHVRNVLESLINNVQKSTLDIGELLYKVKSKGYFNAWGYTTFQDYVETLNIKARKAQYLTRIVDVMSQVGIDRSTYEPLGIARLREITSLDPNEVWKNPQTGAETPMKEFIAGFVEKGEEITMEDLKQHVKVLKGLVGENDLTWRNICMKRSVAETVWDPAIQLAKNNIGSVGKDDEGISKDASDGAAAEVIAVEYLNNPSNNVLPEGEA